MADPALFPCVENPNHGCRNSDAALGLYNHVVEEKPRYKAYPAFGKIARPDGRNTESVSIDSNYPRFNIVSTRDWTIDGEILEKVGRSTGWSGGRVVDGCVALASGPSTDPTGPHIRCSMIVEAVATNMDSGSPVFRVISGNDVELRGMLWGGMPAPDESCWPDPSGMLYCPMFIASNLGGIRMDLEPAASAPLRFHLTGGGGGGGGGGGCIPRPGDPDNPICPE